MLRLHRKNFAVFTAILARANMAGREFALPYLAVGLLDRVDVRSERRRSVGLARRFHGKA